MRYINDLLSKHKVFIQPTYQEMQKYLTSHEEMRIVCSEKGSNANFFKGMGFQVQLHKFGIKKTKKGFKFFWYSTIRS